MTTPTVTLAKAQDRKQVVSAIVLAFVNDPVARWSWPDPYHYLTYFTEFTEVFVGKAFDHEAAYAVAAFSGGALWLPPGVQPDEKALVGVMERSIDPKRLGAVLTLFEKMGGYHPTDPHWYLPLIGVEPAKQDVGTGRRSYARHWNALTARDDAPIWNRRTQQTSRCTNDTDSK